MLFTVSFLRCHALVFIPLTVHLTMLPSPFLSVTMATITPDQSAVDLMIKVSCGKYKMQLVPFCTYYKT